MVLNTLASPRQHTVESMAALEATKKQVEARAIVKADMASGHSSRLVDPDARSHGFSIKRKGGRPVTGKQIGVGTF